MTDKHFRYSTRAWRELIPISPFLFQDAKKFQVCSGRRSLELGERRFRQGHLFEPWFIDIEPATRGQVQGYRTAIARGTPEPGPVRERLPAAKRRISSRAAGVVCESLVVSILLTL